MLVILLTLWFLIQIYSIRPTFDEYALRLLIALHAKRIFEWSSTVNPLTYYLLSLLQHLIINNSQEMWQNLSILL